MKVVIRPQSGPDVPIEDVEPETNIETLKVLIFSTHDQLGGNPEDMRLIYKGQILKNDEARLVDLGYKDGEIIHASPAPAAKPAASAAAPAAQAAPQASGLTGPPPEDAIAALTEMGFPRDYVIQALRAAFNNADRAAEYLMSGNVPPVPDADGDDPMGGGAPAAAAAAAPSAQPFPSMAAQEAQQWQQAAFGPQLLTKAGEQPTGQALNAPKVVLLYFSAHWCPPCRRFTPMLARAYSTLGQQSGVQVIFVSGDRSVQDFQVYYSEMPWLALPFGSPQIQMLNMQHRIQGIPALVALDGRTGQVVDANARDTVSRSGFDLAGCCRQWGADVPEPKSVFEEVASSSAPAGPRWPKVEKIDAAAARAAIQQAEALEEAQQVVFRDTLIKLLENVLNKPDEVKFRSIKKTNKALIEKIFGQPEGAAVVLLTQAGFQDGEEAMTLPGPPDGRAHAVWELLARSARDMKLAKVLEEEKKRPPERSFGGEGGRHAIGRKPTRGGGG